MQERSRRERMTSSSERLYAQGCVDSSMGRGSAKYLHAQFNQYKRDNPREQYNFPTSLWNYDPATGEPFSIAFNAANNSEFNFSLLQKQHFKDFKKMLTSEPGFDVSTVLTNKQIFKYYMAYSDFVRKHPGKLDDFKKVMQEDILNSIIRGIEEKCSKNLLSKEKIELVAAIIKKLRESPTKDETLACKIIYASQLNLYVTHEERLLADPRVVTDPKLELISAEGLGDRYQKYRSMFEHYHAQVNAYNMKQIAPDHQYLEINIYSVSAEELYLCSDCRNSFIFCNGKLFYYYANGDKSEINTRGMDDSQLRAVIKKKDVNALRKLLGSKFPRDRGLELARNISAKSTVGTSVLAYARGKVGDVVSAPDIIKEKITAVSGQPTNFKKKYRRVKAKAERDAVSREYWRDRKSSSTSATDERFAELNKGRLILNSTLTQTKLVQTKTTGLKVWANGAVPTSEKEALQGRGDSYYILSTTDKTAKFYYVDRSLSVPIVTELKIADDKLVTFVFSIYKILGLNSQDRHHPVAERLEVEHAANLDSEEDSISEINQDLSAFITDYTGHIPAHTTYEREIEKYYFSEACDELEAVLQDRLDFAGSCKEQLTAELQEKHYVVLDEDKLPTELDLSENYVYLHPDGKTTTVYEYNRASGTYGKRKIPLATLLGDLGLNIPEFHTKPEHYTEIKLSEDEFTQLDEWLAGGQKGPAPYPIVSGVRYYSDDVAQTIWVSRTEGIFREMLLTDAQLAETQAWRHNPKTARNRTGVDKPEFIQQGMRYFKGPDSFYTPNTGRGIRLIPFPAGFDTNTPPPINRAASLNPQFVKNCQDVLASLRKLEDIPASYFVSSESTVPYTERQELVKRMTAYARDPSSTASQEFFRSSYNIQKWNVIPADTELKRLAAGSPCFFYSPKSNQIAFVNGNIVQRENLKGSVSGSFKTKVLNVGHTPALEALMDKQDPGYDNASMFCKISAADVHKLITTQLENPNAEMKMNTASEIIEEIVADEVKTTNEALKSLGKALLFAGVALAMAFIPGLNIGSIIIGGAALTYLTISIQCLVGAGMLYVAAKTFSKTTMVSETSRELVQLKANLAKLKNPNPVVEDPSLFTRERQADLFPRVPHVDDDDDYDDDQEEKDRTLGHD